MAKTLLEEVSSFTCDVFFPRMFAYLRYYCVGSRIRRSDQRETHRKEVNVDSANTVRTASPFSPSLLGSADLETARGE